MDSQQNLDIVELIQNNPISRLNKTYETVFINKIKQNFTETQQNLFVASLYCYLNYNSKTDYVIELDEVWKWLGFGRKNDCKKVLEKHFILNVDYKISFTATTVELGRPRENILMNINTFKKLCLKSRTTYNYDKILNKELIQKIAELTNSKIKTLKYSQLSYQSFVGFTLKNKTDKTD